MECCCNICCQPFQNDNTENPKRLKKVLSCDHFLCESCYLRLDKTYCPFCRKVFTYSTLDILKRKKLNLNYNWQHPSQINNYIPPDNYNNIGLPSSTLRVNRRNHQFVNEPYSRARKNMNRRRRRNLSFDEVLERRRIIRRRCRSKWMKKNGRMLKETSYLSD